MGKLCFGRVLLGVFCFSTGSKSSCVYMNSLGSLEDMDKETLITSEGSQLVRFGDLVDGDQTLVFKLKPKMVVLRVSMHCNGCAKKVEKHISKMEGVTSIEVDLERKKVTVMGNIAPFEVLESVSKVKTAELWTPI